MTSPTPHAMPALWTVVTLGDFILPPVGWGVATVKAPSILDIDKKKPQGSNKGSTTIQGTEPSEVEIDVKFHAAVWADVEDVLAEVDPNGPNVGVPYDIGHPDTARRNIKSVIVKEVGELTWERGGYVGNVKVKCTEWVAPVDATTGDATKTPDQSKDWHGSDVTGANGSSSSPSTAYGGDDAPDASPE